MRQDAARNAITVLLLSTANDEDNSQLIISIFKSRSSDIDNFNAETGRDYPHLPLRSLVWGNLYLLLLSQF